MNTPSSLNNKIIERLADPAYWIESCLFIVDKDSKRVPFLLNDLQKDYLANRTTRDIILKSRKMGFSTLILGLLLHTCLFTRNARAVVISHEKESTQRLMERLKYMIENSIYPIKCEMTKNGARFPDTESVLWIGTAGSRNFGRGDDITYLHASELGFYESMEVMTSLGEALVNNARVVIESTANGAGTKFHELWSSSDLGKTGYKNHFYPWFRDKGLAVPTTPFEVTGEEKRLKDAFGLSWAQLAWRRKKIRDMTDPRLFPQEFPATPEEAFLASGRMVFDWDAILSQERDAHEPKWVGVLQDKGRDYKIEPIENGPLSIWKTRQEGADYVLTFDSADGVVDGDFSVADIWDTRTWEQVAQFRARIAPDKFGDETYALSKMYGWAPIAGENNYPGNAVLMRLRDRGHPNLWMDPHTRAERGQIEPGFKTTMKSKGQFISDLRASLRDMDIKINSKQTLAELKTFCVLDDGSMAAREGCHDDTVITAAAGAYILKRWTHDPDMKKLARRDHLSVRLRNNKPYGFQQNGTSGIV